MEGPGHHKRAFTAAHRPNSNNKSIDLKYMQQVLAYVDGCLAVDPSLR